MDSANRLIGFGRSWGLRPLLFRRTICPSPIASETGRGSGGLKPHAQCAAVRVPRSYRMPDLPLGLAQTRRDWPDGITLPGISQEVAMDKKSIKPLDTGLRGRRKDRWYFIRKWVRYVFRNRSFLLDVLWVMKIIMKLARISSMFDDS